MDEFKAAYVIKKHTEIYEAIVLAHWILSHLLEHNKEGVKMAPPF